MNNERLKELAYGMALGELSLAEEREFFSLLPGAGAADHSALNRIFDASAMATIGAPVELPPPSLKEKVLGSILKTGTPPPAVEPSLHYVYGDDGQGWQSLPVKGAFVKPLSMSPEKGYAVVLGKLEPGASYPPHKHSGPEEVYILSGDLTIGTTKLKVGDFHHADPGSEHSINYSEAGCTVLVVLTIQDLQAQYAAAEAAAKG